MESAPKAASGMGLLAAAVLVVVVVLCGMLTALMMGANDGCTRHSKRAVFKVCINTTPVVTLWPLKNPWFILLQRLKIGPYRYVSS